MAILGDFGALALQREPAAPGVLKAADLDLASRSVLYLDGAYMTGDRVTLTLAGGLPLAGGTGSGFYFVHRDALDRLSFHSTATDAINRRNAIGFTSSTWADITIEQVVPPVKYVAEIREWNLDLDCAVIDTTPIGVRFGENIKDLVTGAGSFRFLVERRGSDEIMNALDLLNLLLLTGPGAKVAAQFWLHTGRGSNGCDELLPGSIYYEANILIVASSVQVTPDKLIEGAVNFATTEEVNLRIST
jgi:hypothetical protein